MTRRRRWVLAAPLLLLAAAACGRADDPDPSGITPGEAQELNDAATMLDANAVDANALAAEGNRS